MMLRTSFALVVAALTIGVPVAAATPDGYQPQLQTVVSPDALDRYLVNNGPAPQPDGLDRYLRNNAPESGAAAHPDSRPVRSSLGVDFPLTADDGRDWTTAGIGALCGALFAVLAIAGASAIRERRRPALH